MLIYSDLLLNQNLINSMQDPIKIHCCYCNKLFLRSKRDLKKNLRDKKKHVFCNKTCTRLFKNNGKEIKILDNAKLDSIISELVSLGYSSRLIASETGLSQGAVKNRISKLGLKLLPKPLHLKVTNKQCLTCGNELSGMQKKFCSSQCNENPPSSYRSQKKRAIKRKYIAVELLGGKCSICGYNKNYAALVFHHTTPENKKTGLDSRKLSAMTIANITEELEKCILLCHNCHAEIHNPEMMTENVKQWLRLVGFEPTTPGL